MSNSAQIGIALHQMKRGKEYRRLIRVPQDFSVWTQPDTLVYAPDVPEGYDLMEFDFAGQEFRWMAVASKDETMLSLCAPGEDAHSYMGAQIAGIDYRELVRRVQADEEEANFQRKLGKFCVAEGELVLTDQGLVPIEKVSLDMRVWDGVEWVNHTGCEVQGIQEVINCGGVWLTADHVCFTNKGTCKYIRAPRRELQLMVTGIDQTPIESRLGAFSGPLRRIKHTKVCQTYDITNAGPRHRYTVSNYLVSNSNLSFQYRVGSKTALMKARTDYEMDLDETFIKQILATYKAAFKGVAGSAGTLGYWQTAVYRAKMQGYAETFAGRRVQLTGTWSGREQWPMESTAINYPIQGTGADQKYLGLAVLRNLLPKFNAYFYMELHDGLFIIVPRDRSRKAGEVIQHNLSNLPYKSAWGVDLPIKFPVDAKISSESWGDLKGL